MANERYDFERLMGLNKPTPVEIEKAKAVDAMRDQFKLEDDTLSGIEAAMNRNRGLTYVDAYSLMSAYRVMKQQHKNAMEERLRLESLLRAAELRLEQYQVSMIRRLIRRIVLRLMNWSYRA